MTDEVTAATLRSLCLVESAPAQRAPAAFDAIYINLPSRPDRRGRIVEQFRAAGMPARRMQAQTGAETPDWVVGRTWDSTLNSQFDTRTLPQPRLRMTPGERGCSMSHAMLWAMSAARGDADPPILVLEDDVEFDPALPLHVQRLVAVAEAAFAPAERTLLLYLGADVAKWRSRLAYRVGPGQTLREAEYLWQTSSYLLWPAAARALLAGLPLDAPVDNFISRLVVQRRLRALVVVPHLVGQTSPYRNGDILHSSAFAAHVRVDRELQRQLEAGCRQLEIEDMQRAARRPPVQAVLAAPVAPPPATMPEQ
jgi:GR25 family glycosyltransferase involved in LPS biosynthesis